MLYNMFFHAPRDFFKREVPAAADTSREYIERLGNDSLRFQPAGAVRFPISNCSFFNDKSKDS